MAYTDSRSETYHDRRRCRRLHNTGGRIRTIEDTADLEPCSHCVDDPDPADTCTVVKSDGEVCGRDLPCRYHS